MAASGRSLRFAANANVPSMMPTASSRLRARSVLLPRARLALAIERIPASQNGTPARAGRPVSCIIAIGGGWNGVEKFDGNFVGRSRVEIARGVVGSARGGAGERTAARAVVDPGGARQCVPECQGLAAARRYRQGHLREARLQDRPDPDRELAQPARR